MTKSIKRVFIANRGEIVRRIASTAQLLGIETVCVSTYPPPNFLVDCIDEFIFVEEESVSLFLDQQALIRWAKEAHCDSIHPGYGFLSENAPFAKLVVESGLVWVGPSADVIHCMASKSRARKLAESVSIPCLQALQNVSLEKKGDAKTLQSFLKQNPFPLLVKAALGGGGKGMRLIHRREDLEEQMAAASREALKAFSDPSLIVEQYLEKTRHIEVQVLGDQYGHVVILGDRDCSIQRRHQKIIEESPAVGLSVSTRHKLHQAAKDLAQKVGYYSAGTVEFLFPWDESSKDKDDQPFYFLEMNTRLQVEHPVTEEVFACDLVEWQFRIAQGERLPKTFGATQLKRHSIEARLYAEDPHQKFLPSPGFICGFQPYTASGIRWEVGIDTVDYISNQFDPMMAKVVATAEDRPSAIRKLAHGLKKTFLVGPANNVELLISILDHDRFLKEPVATSYLEEHLTNLIQKSEAQKKALQVKADLIFQRLYSEPLLPQVKKLDVHDITRLVFSNSSKSTMQHDQEKYRDVTNTLYVNHRYPEKELRLQKIFDKEYAYIQYAMMQHDGVSSFYLCLDGAQYKKTPKKKRWQGNRSLRSGAKEIRALVPGKVIKVLVKTNDSVEENQSCFILESMKMEFDIKSSYSATVKRVIVSEGEQVEAGKVLAVCN